MILHLQVSYLLVTVNFYSFRDISQHTFEDLKELDQLGHLVLYDETMLTYNQRNEKKKFWSEISWLRIKPREYILCAGQRTGEKWNTYSLYKRDSRPWILHFWQPFYLYLLTWPCVCYVRPSYTTSKSWIVKIFLNCWITTDIS
jgi:hypothetical protein